MNAFRKETNERFDHVDRQLRFFDADLEGMNLEIATQNREIKKLKNV